VRLASFEGTLSAHEVVAIHIALAKAADLNRDTNALQNGEIVVLCFQPLGKVQMTFQSLSTYFLSALLCLLRLSRYPGRQ